MGSRRTMPRSHSANGRFGHGNGITGNSRAGGCSYLSSVRPENRSTLCSVIAQLTQETQPAFLTTLKSKAVSESSNVKFFCVVTGYPIPQLTWYKDDKQLDRFCGLPKYEIFRNGQTHSLHIYNCSSEDAAIYQVSATNTKGIVSCSGVLEVGAMNEFKIHQRYFAKIKQKAESRGKETDGKENQEPIRKISPERSQRKRRSTTEVRLTVPSSTEEKVTEEFIESVCDDSKVRLEKPAEELVGEKSAPLTKTCTKTNNENGILGGIDKTPFVQKKIKICPRSEKKPEEPMEVESCRNIAERQDRAPFGKLLRKKSSEALRAPEGAKKDKESVFKRDEKVSEMDPRRPSRFRNAPQPQQPSNRVIQHTADPGSVDGILKKKGPSPDQTSDQPPQKETKVTQKNPSTQNEVTQAPTWMRGNDAPVNPEAPPDRRLAAADARPQRKIPPKGAAKTEDPRLRFVAPIVKSPQHRRHHSKGLKESLAAPQKSEPLSIAERQSQPDLLVKCVEGIGVQGYKKADENKVKTSKEKTVESVTETTIRPKSQQLQHTRDKGAEVPKPMVVSNKDKKTSSLKLNSELQSNKQTKVVIADPSKKTPSLNGQQPTDVREIPKPLTRVVSVAERTKAQIRAHDTAVTSCAKDIPADSVARPTAADKLQNLRNDESKITAQERKTAPDIIPRNHVFRTTPKEHFIQESHPEKNKIAPKPPSPCPSPATDSLSIECPQDVIALPDAGSSTNNGSNPVNPKEIATQGRKPVDQTSPKENLVKQNHLGKTRTFPEDPSICPLSVIDPLSMEGKIDETDVPDAGSLNNFSSVLGNPRELENELRKQVPGSTSPQHVGDQTSPNDNLVKQSHLGKRSTFQEDSSPSPSSVIDPLSIKCNQDVAAIPRAGSSKTYPSAPVNPKGEATQRPTSRTKSDPIQGKELGLDEKFIPDIKFEGINGTTSQRLIIQHSPTSCSQRALRISSTNGDDTQEDNLRIYGGSMDEDIQGIDILPNSNLKVSPLLQKGECDSLLTPATPQELASGARCKILSSKDKLEETILPSDHQLEKQEVSPPDGTLPTSAVSIVSSPDGSQRSPLLLQPKDDSSSPVEKRSPLLGRRNVTAESNASSQPPNESIQSDKTEKDRRDPCKAPQVIRKIRSESFADASGHLKLWCQFFNILTDSTITWYRNQLEIARITKSAADESQVNLAVVQASSKDSGVYKCTITNDYGSDSTDFLLGPDILAGISLREDHSVGEEIEMAPLVFSKGVADSGVLGSKLFGRVMVHKSCIGKGCGRKVWRAKVIYGLEPVFESGHTCIIKAQRHIAYGGKEEHGLTDRNLDLVKQDCKIQNLAREYCKIFSAEARVIENFGPPLEIIPVYLMYRPANTIPYATVEADLAGVYQKYVLMDHTGRIEMRTTSEVELKCCALQHWIFQWTNGNLLITRLEGVDTRITNIGITVKYTGHQGLQMEGKPQMFEGFVSQHQCNYFCGLLGLRSLKFLDSLTAPAKPKGSRSPLLQRKSQAPGSCSPQAGRRATGSPRMLRKAEQDAAKSPNTAVEVSF
ncbi:alpha-protein kinase 3-like [Hippocampus comes]|uniref:non-specific serine/threonine protein kinase n=1 Tax=Hippocampus comes TaxID=109280 RepID=A0A3Q3DLL2_HIPCM|nr:PREDICTED: alpha-protein kinase 3-like [Hippocampus comes]XP_019722263.1 PREDICTED: alpha-protein kinase 3-like [Hippocampus comes]